MFKFVSENLSVQMVSALQNKENEMNQMQLVQQASESTLKEAAELRRKSRVLLSASEELCQLQEYVHELEASNFDLQSRLEQAQRKAHRRDKKFKAMREEAELLQLKVHQLSYISRVERESFCSTLLSNMSMEEV
ncbi:Hypothetical Protein FCC1311_024672 [Hondaea fermentalgiana]|uniref:GED domain-containing protein n=1 Tax=Hondaea fermentalgiana TaxID=2315210 RepID=A0A2R5G5E0_9STRA|nr:Hypothetical Protein FCC1311_024672 [Hondaea fermentalgiana]|eukprot:GBG26246.1 Hypothetical Protein FCC1311_024672 [Hondaea fermentalgiana]